MVNQRQVTTRRITGKNRKKIFLFQTIVDVETYKKFSTLAIVGDIKRNLGVQSAIAEDSDRNMGVQSAIAEDNDRNLGAQSAIAIDCGRNLGAKTNKR